MAKNPPSYEGNSPYIFVCYAHKDRKSVIRVLDALHKRGYRFWYDNGIPPSSRYTDILASHIDQAEAVLFFVSDDSVNSSYCKDEITFAKSRNKPFVPAYLEETKLPIGLELEVSAQQCVFRSDYDTEEEFLDKLCSTPSFEPCKVQPKIDTAAPPDPAKAASPEAVPASVPKPALQRQEPAKKEKASHHSLVKPGNKPKRPFLYAVLAAAVVIAGIITIISMGGSTGSDPFNSGNYKTYRVADQNVTQGMISAINKEKKLYSLTFVNCSFDEGVLSMLAPKFQGDCLPRFSFRDCTGIDGLAFLSNYDEIEELRINNCGLTDNAVSDLSGIQVTTLDLSGNPYLTQVTLDAQKLLSLDLSNTKVADIGFLASAHKLAILDLENTDVSDLSPIVPLTRITSLNLSGSLVDSLAIELDCLSLTKLYLNGCGLTSADGLQDYVKLTEVDLGKNSLTDVSFLARLAPNLELLDLSGNNVNGNDLQWLNRAYNLRSLKLDHIDMSGCQLSYLKELSELRTLSAKGCKISDISGLSGCDRLSDVQLGFNAIKSISPLPLHNYDVLDLAYNQLQEIPTHDKNIELLLITGNPLIKLTAEDMYRIDYCITDYFDNLEHAGDRPFYELCVSDCPRDKKLDVQKTAAYTYFCTKEEQLEMIKSKFPALDYDGFEEMYLSGME